MPQITVESCHCSECGPKPLTDFNKPDGRGPKWCKACVRTRVDPKTKLLGRQSTSLSPAEVKWIAAVMRALPCSGLSHMTRLPEYAKFSRKITGMVGRIKDKEGDR